MKDDEKVTLTNGQFTILALFVVMFFVVVFVCIANIKSNGYDDSDTKPVAAQTEEKPVQKEEPCPVSLTRIFVRRNSINTPVAQVDVKNNSSKRIDAMRFWFYAKDGFGEIVTYYGDPYRKEIAQNFSLVPGDTLHCEWTLHGLDKGVSFTARLISIHFVDGSVWNATENQYVTITYKR